MAYQKMFVFDVSDLLKLCTHYFDGAVPLDSQVVSVGFNPMLQRFIGIEVESDEWDCIDPLHLRYDGEKVLSWKQNSGEDPVWSKNWDTPNRQ